MGNSAWAFQAGSMWMNDILSQSVVLRQVLFSQTHWTEHDSFFFFFSFFSQIEMHCWYQKAIAEWTVKQWLSGFGKAENSYSLLLKSMTTGKQDTDFLSAKDTLTHSHPKIGVLWVCVSVRACVSIGNDATIPRRQEMPPILYVVIFPLVSHWLGLGAWCLSWEAQTDSLREVELPFGACVDTRACFWRESFIWISNSCLFWHILSAHSISVYIVKNNQVS